MANLYQSPKISKILTIVLVSILFLTTAVLPVLAQTDQNPGIIVDPGDTGLSRPIKIPTFLSLDQIRSFSVFSYLALALSLVFVLLTIFWVYLIIRNAVKMLQSEGDEGKIQEASKGIRSVFIGIGFMIGFFVVLFIVGSFFGLGSIFSWPKKLSICTTGKLYITLALENPDKSDEALDAACFINTN